MLLILTENTAQKRKDFKINSDKSLQKEFCKGKHLH